MSKSLLRHISLFGIGIYLLALIVVSAAFPNYALQTKWMFWGVGEVLFFFLLTCVFYPRWKYDEQKLFRRKVFSTALAIRALYAFLSVIITIKQAFLSSMVPPTASVTTKRAYFCRDACVKASLLLFSTI